MQGHYNEAQIPRGFMYPVGSQVPHGAIYTMGLKPEAPPRRALQQIRHNQANVSVLQRLKNLVAPPRSDSPSKKAWVDGDTPTKRVQEITSDSPSSSERVVSIRSASVAATSPAKGNPMLSVMMQSEDLLQGVLRVVDMQTGLNCRAVCKQWKKTTDECGIQPLEAGLTGEELQRGLQSQQLLDCSMERVKQIYTPEHCAFLANHIARQESVTEEMRVTLVNWVTEVHFKFRFREPALQLALQLIDRYMSEVITGRRKYQTVGVTAFLLGCKYEERHSPNVGDLSYITDYSSSRQDIVDMETAMLAKFDFELERFPKPGDFVERFAKAGGIEAVEISKAHHSFEHSVILYFIDVAALNYKYCGMKPSEIAAAAISCALKALGKPSWNKRLAYYTQIESIEYLASSLIQSAKKTDTSCLKLKYSSSRFGGDDAEGKKGIYTFMRSYLDSVPAVVHTNTNGVYV